LNGHGLQTSSLTFAQYLRFRVAQQSPEAYDFWCEYLANSQMIDSRAIAVRPRTNPRQMGPLVVSSSPPGIHTAHEFYHASELPDSVKPDANSRNNVTRPVAQYKPEDVTKDEFRVKSLRDIPLPSIPQGITLATLVRAACSIILAKLTGRQDLVFGNIVNGRDALLESIETLSGPTVTISPFRAVIQRNWCVKDLLNHVQTQYTRTMPFATIDPKEIMKHSTTWSPETGFGSILTHQNISHDLTYSINGTASQWDILDFGIPTDFHVVTWTKQERLYVHISGSSKIILPDAADEIADRLCETIVDLAENPLRSLNL